jgi:signal transduction histidine kinase
MGRRLTARSRLAILYTALVFTAGLVLTGLTYLLVAHSMQNRWVIVKGDPSRSPTPTPAGHDELPPMAQQLRSETLNQLLTRSAIALAVVTVLAAVLGWLIAGRVLRPIRDISTTARRLSATNMSARVPINGPADELATLAETINGMLDRVQAGVAHRDRLLASQRMFVANAAHELRTPLTTMRTAIDVTLDGRPTAGELTTMAVDVREAVEHSQRTIDGLLVLARSQAGPHVWDPVDLAALTAVVIDSTGDRAAGCGIDVRASLDRAPVHGEPTLLDRMIGNLLDNAVRYNERDGHIEVTTGAMDGEAFLRVSNTGLPVSADEADRLLEPFVRGRANGSGADNGAGLGLSIVRAVVTAHEGRLISAARPGGGMEIDVRLPLDVRR